ncbi:MAG TPA: TatD family hydrolase, partial [Oscillospiraceae bacterium]|nr:TatD family hydrolase [Oscillospiraceae bacterium]
MSLSNIFDSHAHYDDKAFDEDRDSLLENLPKAGVCGVLNCAGDKKSSYTCLELTKKYDFVFAACGVHPHSAADANTEDFLEGLPELLSGNKCLAVGEIGLDYHYDFSPRDVQLVVFEKQIKLALELGKPIVVHNREAHEDTLRLLKKYKPQGVMHSFSGSVEMAAELIKLGMYIGLSGVVTFKNARKPLEVARFVPLERLLLETDCPYLAPVPFRGKRSDSSMIAITAEVIA